MVERRDFLAAGAIAAGGAVLRATPSQAAIDRRPMQWESTYSGGSPDRKPLPPGLPGRDYEPVVIPDGKTVPFEIVGGVKVFHVVVSEMEHEFTPGLVATCWGYNDHVNSTVFEAVEGERVRIYVTNKLAAPTTIHWHGIYLPNGMDGVSGITQRPIPPGETFKYEWTLRQFGTFMYLREGWSTSLRPAW